VELVRAFVLAEQAGITQLAAMCLLIGGINAWGRGDVQAYHDLETQALERFRAAGIRCGQGATIANLGDAARIYGDYAAARAYNEQSIHIFNEIGHRRFASIGYSELRNTIQYVS
jgi:tetratricopeptide (TPR) repeat protein